MPKHGKSKTFQKGGLGPPSQIGWGGAEKGVGALNDVMIFRHK